MCFTNRCIARSLQSEHLAINCLTMPLQSTAATPWSDLPPELLGRIASCCPNPDRARFRSVCRSWHLAVRHHCPQTALPPWVVFPDGSFLMLSDSVHHLPSAILPHGIFLKPSDGGVHRLLTLPESTTCVGSTNGWLALCDSYWLTSSCCITLSHARPCRSRT